MLTWGQYGTVPAFGVLVARSLLHAGQQSVMDTTGGRAMRSMTGSLRWPVSVVRASALEITGMKRAKRIIEMGHSRARKLRSPLDVLPTTTADAGLLGRYIACICRARGVLHPILPLSPS